MLGLAVTVLIVLAVANLVFTDQTRTDIMETQAKIDELEATLAANTSATTSIVALLTGFLDAAEAAKDDPQELQALVDGYRANTERLSAAVLAATPAENTDEPTDNDTNVGSGGQDGDGENSAATNPDAA